MNFPTWTTCANKWCVTRKLRQRQNQPSRSHLLSLWRDDWELSWQFYKNEEVVARYFKNGVNFRSGNVPILVYDCILPSYILVRTYLHTYVLWTYPWKWFMWRKSKKMILLKKILCLKLLTVNNELFLKCHWNPDNSQDIFVLKNSVVFLPLLQKKKKNC